ncbi:hypothetical protein ABMX48_36425 [Streptomyces cavourensis]
MDAEFWVAFGTGVIALCALFHSSRVAAKARVKTIEDAYIARYWQILERFPSAFSSPTRAQEGKRSGVFDGLDSGLGSDA